MNETVETSTVCRTTIARTGESVPFRRASPRPPEDAHHPSERGAPADDDGLPRHRPPRRPEQEPDECGDVRRVDEGAERRDLTGVLARPGSCVMAVSVGPGATTFTVMRRGASSWPSCGTAPSARPWSRRTATCPPATIVRLPSSTTRPPSTIGRRGCRRAAQPAATWTSNMARRSSARSDPSGFVRWKPRAVHHGVDRLQVLDSRHHLPASARSAATQSTADRSGAVRTTPGPGSRVQQVRRHGPADPRTAPGHDGERVHPGTSRASGSRA